MYILGFSNKFRITRDRNFSDILNTNDVFYVSLCINEFKFYHSS